MLPTNCPPAVVHTAGIFPDAPVTVAARPIWVWAQVKIPLADTFTTGCTVSCATFTDACAEQPFAVLVTITWYVPGVLVAVVGALAGMANAPLVVLHWVLKVVPACEILAKRLVCNWVHVSKLGVAMFTTGTV